MSPGLPKCGGCDAYVRWLVMRGGQRVAVDLAPDVARGTIWIDPQGRGVFLDHADRDRAADAGEDLWVRHSHSTPRASRDQLTLDLSFGGPS